MKLVTFSTPEGKARGLQFMRSIPEGTVYRFSDIAPGTVFHARNVPEAFDIFFMSAQNEILKRATMVPEHSECEAPPGTSYVLEAKVGTIV